MKKITIILLFPLFYLKNNKYRYKNKTVHWISLSWCSWSVCCCCWNVNGSYGHLR